ncbi:MAG: alkaline phosphatase D family protein, partial [Pseudomonadales bacterium]|nr:alkaline phosphatase D family protein [Pseudomonadales bacterium]
PDVPKIVVCGSVIGPVSDALAANSARHWTDDTWLGYPATIAWLTDLLISRDARQLVFIAGDLHFSAVAALNFRHGEQQVEALQIVASGFYSPLPFTNSRRKDYCWQQPVRFQVAAGYELESVAWQLTDETGHFLRLDFAQQSEESPVANVRPETDVDKRRPRTDWTLKISAWNSDNKQLPAIDRVPPVNRWWQVDEPV